jgi:hypothetical protein
MGSENFMTQFRAGGESPGRSWHCLEEEKLAAYVEQRVAGREKEQVESHLAACRACRDQVGFLVRAEEERTLDVVPAGWLAGARELERPGARAWMSAWYWGTAATAAACLLLAALWFRPQPEARPSVSGAVPAPSSQVLAQAETKPLPPVPPAPVVRNQAHAAAGPEVIFPKAHSTVAREGLAFRWKEVKSALSYEVRLVNAEGDVLWEQRVQGQSTKPAPTLTLKPGETCFLWVKAYLPDGRTVQSKAIPFTVADEK